MPKVTNEQLAFADRMSSKQWDVLSGLVKSGPAMLSASESGDDEARALIAYKLAQCFHVTVGDQQLFAWYATGAGHLLTERAAGFKLPWAGPSFAVPPRE
jgi:hypothetical protein